MSEQLCPCGKPTAGTALCRDCRHTLDVALANIPAYWAETEIIETKQARYGSGTRSSIGKSQPLGMDPRFVPGAIGSEIKWVTRNTVGTWARVVIEEHPPVREQYPRDTMRSICAYLQANLSWIVGQRWAPQMLDELLDVERRLRRLVDRPTDLVYRGVCGSVEGEVVCERPLYAEPNADFVRCGDCGATHDAAQRRKVLLDEAEDRLATVRAIARVVTILGDPDVSEAKIESRVNTWVWRSRLKAQGHRVVDGKVRPVYRVGDVLNLLADDARDRSA